MWINMVKVHFKCSVSIHKIEKYIVDKMVYKLWIK